MSESHRVPPRSSGVGQHRAPRKSRLRLAVTGAATLAVVGGSTAVAVLGGSHQAPVTRADGQESFTFGSEIASRAPATLPNESVSPTGSASTPTTESSGSPTPGHTQPSRPRATTSPKTRAKAPAAPAPTTQAPSSQAPRSAPAPAFSAATMSHAPVAPTATADTGDAVQQVLALINSNRAAQGLAPYTLLSGLDTSAAAHDRVMAGGCGLSHQCPGEAAFGDRETAAGVRWTAAGENIGEGGGVTDSDSAIAAGAVGLTQMMLDEKPPDDGHRQNILSSSYTHIGIDVYRDSSGTVWMTQDFSN